MAYLLIGIFGIIAGIISGIVGTGASVILIPALAYSFGPKAAVPVMAIAAIMGNISRVILWRKEVNWQAFLLYSIPGVPAAFLGARTLWTLPPSLSNLCIGLFFMFLIPLRYWAKSRALTLNNLQLALAGAVIGYLTGLVFSTGPLTIPVFTGYGLIKGSLLSTEAAASFAIYLTKASTFATLGALPQPIFIAGILVGCTLVIGLYIGKRFILKLSETTYNRLIDMMIIVAGISMIWDAIK